jgi:hypothetical protein
MHNSISPGGMPHKSRMPARLVKVDAADAKAVASAKAIIALIYNTRANSNQPLLTLIQANVRFKELETVFAYTWRGQQLPDDDAGRHDLWIAACHIWHLARQCGPILALRQWAAQWAPWCGPDELQALIDRVDADPRKWTADELAHELGVAVMPFAVRQALGLTTIGSIDVDKAGRTQRRGAKKKENNTAWRRRQGSVSREEYLAANTANRDKPWLALGISKPTYYRRKKREAQCGTARETSADTPKKGNVLLYPDLSQVEAPMTTPPMMSSAERVKRDGAGHHDILVGEILDPVGFAGAPPPSSRERTWEDMAAELFARPIVLGRHIESGVAAARRLRELGR